MAALAVLSAGILAAMLLGGPAGQVLFGALVVLFPLPLMALGALRRGQLGRLVPVLVLLGILLEGGFLGMLALAGRVSQAPWIAGFPAAAALLLTSVWLVPLVIVSLAYGLTFPALGIRDEDLTRLRRLRQEPGRDPDPGSDEES
ncbi:MAG: hypothetical protein SX243_11880 [Acidobacteriota bacterium]|nr:hypothetical protein [Acidobacteriota bacterium]